jgi:hypothetical protein
MLLKEFELPIGNNTVLNPKLWDNMRLKSDVRGALIRIAEDFIDFVDLPFEVLDIVVAGGNANYTYTNKSDLDLHIIADFDKIECDREAAELFDAKRLLYKKDHNITVKGIPVELYVEDHRTPAVSAAYSIVKDNWIRKPQRPSKDWDKEEVDKMIKVWKIIFAETIKTGDLHSCRTALKLLRDYRKLGLKTQDKEYSVPNLVYKSLRNDQTLEGLVTLINKLHDEELSLNQQ